jgi:hypothetical protein
MGNIPELESDDEKLKEQIEKVYGQIDSLDKILEGYPETDFTRMKIREQSLLEKILPSKKI